MLYRDVIAGFAAARGAASREWRISPTLVMSVELDMSIDAMEIPAHSSRRQEMTFLRIAFFRQSDEATSGWVPVHDVTMMSQDEAASVLIYRDTVGAWVTGYMVELPRSTSTVIADRLRPKR